MNIVRVRKLIVRNHKKKKHKSIFPAIQIDHLDPDDD